MKPNEYSFQTEKMAYVILNMEKYEVVDDEKIKGFEKQFVRYYVGALSDSNLDFVKPCYVKYIKTYEDICKYIELFVSRGNWFDELPFMLENKLITWENVIASREDLYEYLVENGVDDVYASKVVEFVRCGRANERKDNNLYNRKLWKKYRLDILKKIPSPAFIDYCENVLYLCSKAETWEVIKLFIKYVYYCTNYPKELRRIAKIRVSV